MITFEQHGGKMCELHSYEFDYKDLSNNENYDDKLSYEAQWEALRRNPNRSKLFAHTNRDYDYRDSLGDISSDLDATVKHMQLTDSLCQGKSYHETMKIAFIKYPDLRTAYYEKLNRKESS